MSDKLVFEVDSVEAERHLQSLTQAAEQLGRTFKETKGATSALKELRLLLTGLKGQRSAFDELTSAMNSFSTSADGLKSSFANSIGQLSAHLTNELRSIRDGLRTGGLAAGQAYTEGLEAGIDSKAAVASIQRHGRTVAAAARAEATRTYEAMIAGQSNAQVKDVGSLFKLEEAGATLSPYHKQVLANWKKSSAETFKALKRQMATERSELEAAVKAETAALQGALKGMEDSDSLRRSSLSGIYKDSLGRGKFNIAQVKNSLKAERSELEATVKSENAALQSALKGMEETTKNRKLSLAEIYKDSLSRGKFSIAQVKNSLKAERSELEATVKSENAALQAALKGMEETTKNRKLSLAEIYKDSLSRGKFSIAQVKSSLKAERSELEATIKSENAALQAALKVMEETAKNRKLSLAEIYKDSLSRGKFSIAQVKSSLKAERSELEATVKSENAALQAALKEMEAREKTRKQSLTSIYEGSLLRGRQDLARVKQELKYQADQIIQAQQAELKRIQAQVASATNIAAGAYQAYNPSTGLKGSVVPPNPAELNAISKGLRTFTMDANDAHSAARGLASGFGLLWLTWGNLLPLLAGATVSHSFAKIIKSGAEVQHTLTEIKVLAEATTTEVMALGDEMARLATTGPFGPREIAAAMKTLALAGLDAKQTLAAIPEVLNFAVAGSTSIDEAAESLTTIGTAFNISAQNYVYISDVISKTAAESKTSVESISEAFKTASVINQQYGVSLQDTATGLALLANAGIQGTAAGTAMRNMYADISGRTPKVTKALQQLGVDAIDPLTGKMRDQATVFNEMLKALASYKPAEQSKFISNIFSERGSKSAIAIMNALRKSADEMSTDVVSAYTILAQKVTESAGFATLAAAEMSLTPLNQMKQVSATLESTLVESFSTLQPYLLQVAKALQDTFSSENFKSGIRDTIVLVSEVTKFFVENAATVANLALGYVAFKAVISGVGGLLSAIAVGSAAATAGATSLGIALSVLTKAHPVLAVISGLVTLGAAAWGLYALNSDKAKTATDDYTGSSAENLLDALDKEFDRLQKVNAARAAGISLQESEMRLAMEAARQEPASLKAAREALERVSGESDPTKQIYYKVPAYIRIREQAEKRLAFEQEKHGGNLLKLEQRKQQITEMAAEAAERARAETQKALEIPSGLLAMPTLPDRGAMGLAASQGRTSQNYLTDLQTLIANKRDELETDKALAESARLRNKYESALKTGKLDTTGYKELLSTLKQLEPIERGLSAKAGENLVKDLLGDKTNIADYDQKIQQLSAALYEGSISTEQFLQAQRALQVQGPLEKLADQALAAKNAMDDYILSAAKAAQRGLEGLGIGSEARSIASTRYGIEDKFDQDALKLTREMAAKRKELGLSESQALPKMWADSYARQTDIIRDARAEALRIHEESNAQILLSNQSWEIGASRALQDYAANAANVASGVESMMSNAFKGMEDALVTFATTGKLSFRDLANSMIADMIRIQIRSAMFGSGGSGILGSLFGAGMAALGGWSSAGVQASGAVTTPVHGATAMGTTLAKLAKGGAFNSDSLSQYRNQIHDTPKLFAFAKGAGVFGEAGPEAIMPLTRTSSGDLGVRTIDSGGGNLAISVEVYNEGAPAEATAEATQQPDGSYLVKVMLKAVADDMASGGVTARATQRRFNLSR